MDNAVEIKLTHKEKALVYMEQAVSNSYIGSRSKRSLIEEAIKEVQKIGNDT